MTLTTTAQSRDPMPALIWNLACRMLGPVYTEAQPHSVEVFDWSQSIWNEALDIARERKPLPQLRPPRIRGQPNESRDSKDDSDAGVFAL